MCTVATDNRGYLLTTTWVSNVMSMALQVDIPIIVDSVTLPFPGTFTGLIGESIQRLNEQHWMGVTAPFWSMTLLHGLMVLPLIIFSARSTGLTPSWTKLRSWIWMGVIAEWS